MIRKIPIGEATELEGREAYEALLEHFNWPEQPTQPMALEDLPAPLTLHSLEADAEREALRRAGLAQRDLWRDAS